MSTTTKQADESREFRRYRQVLVAGYLAIAAAACALLTASVIRGLFFPAAHAGVAPTLDAVTCERKISAEIESIGLRLSAQISPSPSTQAPTQGVSNAAIAARLATQCKDVEADSTTVRDLTDALAALDELARARPTIEQFERDVATPLRRARRSLARARQSLSSPTQP